MKENYETQQQAIDRVAEIDKLFGFPDEKSDTLTYAIPFQEEEGIWSIEVGADLEIKEAVIEQKEKGL